MGFATHPDIEHFLSLKRPPLQTTPGAEPDAGEIQLLRLWNENLGV